MVIYRWTTSLVFPCLHLLLAVGSAVRLQLGSSQESCLLAVAWMFTPSQLRPLQEGLCNQMHLKTLSREKSAVMGRSLYLPAVQGEIPEKSKAQHQHSRADQEIPFLWTRKVQGSLLWLWKLLVIVEWSKDGRKGVVLWVAREDTFFQVL